PSPPIMPSLFPAEGRSLRVGNLDSETSLHRFMTAAGHEFIPLNMIKISFRYGKGGCWLLMKSAPGGKQTSLGAQHPPPTQSERATGIASRVGGCGISSPF